MIFGGGLDMRAALEQRQGAAADEVDLEAEQDVVGAGRGDQRVDVGADAEQRADEPADMRRHGDHDVAARDGAQRFGHFAILLPLRPQFGLGGFDLIDEAVVELAQARGLVQVGERKTGDAQGAYSMAWTINNYIPLCGDDRNGLGP